MHLLPSNANRRVNGHKLETLVPCNFHPCTATASHLQSPHRVNSRMRPYCLDLFRILMKQNYAVLKQNTGQYLPT